MNPNKTPLVLLCGLLCDHRVWDGVADRLGDTAQVTIHSFAGCRTITEMAEQVLAAAPERFALAGHSMGGRVALEVYRLAPERVMRLALLNTGVHPRSESEVPGRRRLLDLAFDKGMAAVAEAWLPPMVGETCRADRALMADLTDMILAHTPEQFDGEIQALLNRPDAEAVLPLVNVPTLLLSSDEDQWSPVAQHADIQRQLPGSRLVALSGVGHMSTVEAPQAIADALRQWLEE